MDKKTRQKAAERLFRHILSVAGHIRTTDVFLVRLTSIVWCEMLILQKFVDHYGTTYEILSKSGDIYTKHRPEHQQLVECRTRLLTLFKELGMSPAGRSRVLVEVEELDEIAELLAMTE